MERQTDTLDPLSVSQTQLLFAEDDCFFLPEIKRRQGDFQRQERIIHIHGRLSI